MKFSLAIVTVNRAKELTLCLQSLAEQSIGNEHFEVIIVDNGSIDNTRSVVQNCSSNFKNIVVLAKRIQQSLPMDTIIKVIRPKFNPHNLHAEYTDEMLDYIRDIKKNRFYFDRVKFNKDENKEPAWPQKMYVNNKRVSFQQMIVKKEHNFKGYKCSAGSLRFFIEPNGDIFPCTRLTTSRKIAADGTTKRDHTTKNPYLMGNINERNFKIYDKYITCPVDWCPCLPDALADKYKINTVS